MNNTKILLQGAGIQTGKITKGDRGCNSITILANSRELFERLIGFSHPTKSKKLKETVKNDIYRKSQKRLSDKVDELFSKETNITRSDICRKLNSNTNSVTEIIYKLRKEGKLNSKFAGKNKEYLWSTVSSSG